MQFDLKKKRNLLKTSQGLSGDSYCPIPPPYKREAGWGREVRGESTGNGSVQPTY